MKYLFVFVLSVIILFLLALFIGGVVVLLSLLTGGHLFALVITLVVLIIGGALLFNLSSGLFKFIKANDLKSIRAAPIIDAKVRENITLNLICIEIGLLLLAGCGYILRQYYPDSALSLLFICLVVLLIPGLIVWLYSIKNNA